MKDSEGFTQFVEVRSTTLVRLGYVLTGDRHLAEDLLQTALLKIAQRWGRIGDPLAYAKRIMINESNSWWRRRKIREHPIDGAPEQPSAEDTAESVARRDIFVQALRRLSAKQRTVLVLRYFEDMSEADAAEVMGCTVGTVKSQTHYALKKLRQLAPELTQLDAPIAVEAG